ncbi:MAG: sigma-54 dependent transcriptional regulator [Acidobacteria bacterium]|nr:sigma-54 dependent transcriptional regulator [Acidobacteriota bacterium]MCI0721835.1 sigma-54 dependent transcriptional regulator [Acidobacteriota bacterium]
MNKQRILIVDDEPSARSGLAKLVSSWNFQTDAAENGEKALALIPELEPAVVITDLSMPVMDGMTLLKRIKEDYPALSVIMLTAQATIDSAVEAMRVGAYDYLEKPPDLTRLRILLDKCLEAARKDKKVQLLENQVKYYGAFGDMAGNAPQMLEVYRLVELVAPSTASVLITGESGTGKELVARNIHLRSKRKEGPFIAINCSAIPETLMESEIFGHEKGAFTGALERRLGCFELANGGTIFLDEIAEMPVGTQSKLLRVIEERKFRRLGSKAEIDVDVRIVAATNKLPLKAVEAGELRNDLYYRLNVFCISLPPLRDRLSDIPVLTEALIRQLNDKHGKKVKGVADKVLKLFSTHNWPGNVRELRNVVERSLIVCDTDLIEERHLPVLEQREVAPSANSVAIPVGTTVAEAEKRLIYKTLEFTENNKTRASEILGVSLKTLHNKLNLYDAEAQN